jgi:hypothetical protein
MATLKEKLPADLRWLSPENRVTTEPVVAAGFESGTQIQFKKYTENVATDSLNGIISKNSKFYFCGRLGQQWVIRSVCCCTDQNMAKCSAVPE